MSVRPLRMLKTVLIDYPGDFLTLTAFNWSSLRTIVPPNLVRGVDHRFTLYSYRSALIGGRHRHTLQL